MNKAETVFTKIAYLQDKTFYDAVKYHKGEGPLPTKEEWKEQVAGDLAANDKKGIVWPAVIGAAAGAAIGKKRILGGAIGAASLGTAAAAAKSIRHKKFNRYLNDEAFGDESYNTILELGKGK